MDKIATAEELQAELRTLWVMTEEPTPSRARLAELLGSLSDRLAGSHGDASNTPLKPHVAWHKDGIAISLHFPVEVVWADTKAEAEKWFKSAITNCERCLQELDKLNHP